MNKIVLITPSLKTGGGNRVFFELANCLWDEYEIEIIYPNNSDEGNTFNIDSRIKIQTVGVKTSSKIQKILNIKRTISYVNKAYKDIPVIVSDPIFCLFINSFKDQKNIYRFIQADDYCIFDNNHIFNNIIIKKIYKLMCKKSYKAKLNYIFNSRFTYDSYLNVSKRNDVPYKLIYPAVNHEVFYNANSSYRDSGNSICVVGRRHKLKGLKTFQFALEQLPKEILEKITNIYIISHDDLSEFSFSKQVQIIKPKSDIEIAEYYNRSNIFISTSWWEGFGLPALEAMSCGCAVITSDNKGCREYAFDKKNCLFFEPKNVEQLINCIRTLLESKELRENLSKQGEKDSYKFSWINSAKQLKEILSE